MTRTTEEKTFELIAVIVGLSCLFVPLILVNRFELDNFSFAQRKGAEVAVGIAVILRTTFRRLLRAGTSNLLRTSLGAFTRTTARTFTRRLVRVIGRFLYGIFAVGAFRALDREAQQTPGEKRGVYLISLTLGLIALFLSFWFIADKQDPETIKGLTDDGTVSLSMIAVLAALPLLVYTMAGFLIGKFWGTSIRIHTALDGLLLQAYFSGAGSFLPMTTDMEYEGDEKHEWKISVGVLLILFACHLGFGLVGTSHVSSTLSTFFLIYCFVYSFPIRPLEGHAIWHRSKLLWGAIWIPILISFVKTLPDTMVNML